MKYIFVITFICILSCKAQKENSTNSDNDIELIANDAHSGIETFEASVISDAKSLAKFYSRINKSRKPGLRPPTVDFSKEMLLILCLGKHKGQSIPVLKKSEKEDSVLVTVQLLEQNNTSKNADAGISYPFFIYTMPFTTKRVSIRKQGF